MTSRRADAIAYAVAAIILIVGGAVFRTPILNWISGPAIVIAVVTLVGGWLDKRSNGSEDGGEAE